MFTGLELWELVAFSAALAWTALVVSFSIGAIVGYALTFPSTRAARQSAPTRAVRPQLTGAMPAAPTVSGAVG